MNAEFVEIVKRNNYVILDTETTGLDKPAEICQIAIIDQAQAVKLYTHVKTARSIPAEATAIHGITDANVINAPTWNELCPTIRDLLKGRDVVVYNAVYDRKMMHWTDEAWQLPRIEWKSFGTWHCAMEAYAAFWGVKHRYYRTFRWQKLSIACRQQRLKVSDAHDALGDCKMTYALMNACVRRIMQDQEEAQS